LRIGIFDSGVGGLTVLKEIHRRFPNVDIVYVGDTARVPYGNKSKQTVIRYSLELSGYLIDKGVELIIVACNTASSCALDTLSRRLPVPVLGVIEPGVRQAVRFTKKGLVGVIGTTSTIRSGAYQRMLEERGIVALAKACPLFVPLVEEGLLEGDITSSVVRYYLEDFKESGIDTLILGCTHYPLLRGAIGEFLEGVSIVDSAEVIARDLREFIKPERCRTGGLNIYFTDISPNLESLVNLIVGEGVSFQLAELEDIKTSI
jgi:glutamate racemase